MPFEFTGEAPALAGSVGSFASFAGANLGATSRPTARLSVSFGGTPSSSFGSAGQIRPSASPWHAAPTSTDVNGLSGASASKQTRTSLEMEKLRGNDALPRALERALQGRTAVLGALDVGGDEVLKDYFGEMNDTEATASLHALITNLESVAAGHPTTIDFLRFVFDQAAAMKGEARPVKRRPERGLAKARTTKRDACHDFTAPMQQELEVAINAKFSEYGWSTGSRWVNGRCAAMTVFLLLQGTTGPALVQALEEENVVSEGDEGRLPEFASWCKTEMERIRTSRGPAAADDDDDITGARDWPQQSDGGDDRATYHGKASSSSEETYIDRPTSTRSDLAFFRPRADLERKYAKMAKSGDYTGFGLYLGYRNKDSVAETARCCNKRAEPMAMSFVNAHLYLSDQEATMLKDWVEDKLYWITNAQPRVVTQMVMTLLDSRDAEAFVKARCESELQRCLLDDTKEFVDALFNALATGSYKAADQDGPQSPVKPNPSTRDQPFRLLNLPAELRTWIYRHALVPGEVRLRLCPHLLPYGVSPAPTIGLLTTCKQIHSEAKDLLYENTFIVDGVIEHGLRRMFHTRLLPDNILPRLTSLVIIFNATPGATGDWRQLRQMTGLRNLTICGFSYNLPGVTMDWRPVLHAVFQCIPDTCALEFGPRTRAHNQHLQSMIRELNALRKDVNLIIASTQHLESVANETRNMSTPGSRLGL